MPTPCQTQPSQQVELVVKGACTFLMAKQNLNSAQSKNTENATPEKVLPTVKYILTM